MKRLATNIIQRRNFHINKAHQSESVETILENYYTKPFNKKILLIGAPGSGKGTYASRASKIFSIPHISSGDFIRQEISNPNSKLAQQFNSFVLEGKLVPDEIVYDFIIEKIQSTLNNSNNKQSEGFLLDGFPRNLNQAKKLQSNPNGLKFDLVINLDLDEDIIVTKVTNRRVCSNCGMNYNFAHIKKEGIDMPPLLPKVEDVCDQCGAKHSLIQREDDREEVIRKRLKEYNELTFPIIEFYKELGILRNFEVAGGVHKLLPSFIKLLLKGE
ncbi:hypothetical protein ABK040_004436 [Willaertia magna]